MEHIFKQQGQNSTSLMKGSMMPKSRFYQDNQIRSIIDQAMKGGTLTQGSPWKITHTFITPIGTTTTGAPAHNLMIFIRNGIIHTAFPY
jgi:hypothetical protein